ncbi:MAG: TetR/AcrR family transcriptional regulator [Jatrophihabitantaceae bacterium]
MSERPAPSARARARAGMIDDIKRAARDRLAVDGANLSLRAVARDIGVVSSAVYRYFASRDELLTALIIDAYDDLGAAAESAEGAVPRRELAARWLATGRAIRAWAIANPHEYALTYGSPVPGYAAPQDTIGPASRPVLVLLAILRDGAARGVLRSPGDRLPRAVRADVEKVATFEGFGGIPPALLARGMTAWAQLFGTLSFELFGRLRNGVSDYEAYFDHQLRSMAAYLGM